MSHQNRLPPCLQEEGMTTDWRGSGRLNDVQSDMCKAEDRRVCMKKCPFCAEEIQDEAIVCKHCGRDLVARPGPPVQVQLIQPKAKTSPATWGCLGLLLFLLVAYIIGSFSGSRKDAASQSAPRPTADLAPPTDVSFQKVGGQGQVTFILVSKTLASERATIEQRARNYCDSLQPDWCKLLIWKDQKRVPKKLPMSDSQLAAQVASYTRNRATRYDCFLMMRKGEGISATASAGCS